MPVNGKPKPPARPSGSSARSGARRRAARLGAVQALYQIALSAAPPKAVVAEFLDQRLGEEIEGLSLAAADRDLFVALVEGVAGECEALDDMLAAVLSEGWPVERLETLLKIILRAGAYELGHWPDVPARVIVSQYVDLAAAFFDGKEPGMANGVLDGLARALRPEEFAKEGAPTLSVVPKSR